MDNLAVILTSSFLAAGLTSLANWFIHRNNFKNDYFKKVIEYRIKSNEQVSELLNMFPFLHNVDEADSQYDHDRLGQENFHKILSLLNSLVNNGYWLSNEMKNAIAVFHKEIAGFYDEYNGDANEEVRKMAEYWEETRAFKSNILTILYRDMANLHDVSEFLKEKKKASSIQV